MSEVENGGDGAKNRPSKELFASSPKGGVKALVWENLFIDQESQEERSFQSVTLRKVYREGEEWKESDSFTANDLLRLREVVDEAIRLLVPVKVRTQKDSNS